MQVSTLLKTIFLLSDTAVVDVFILNNDEEVFNRTVEDVAAWGVETEHRLRLECFLVYFFQPFLTQAEKCTHILSSWTGRNGQHV